MTPWNTQENVSRMEAVLRLEMPYVSAISWAMGFAITMATVLLAVAMSMAPTSSPMPSWPPFRLRNRRLMPFNRATKPPYSRMSAQMALTSTATMVVSNMPAAPVPMLPSRSVAATAPVGHHDDRAGQNAQQQHDEHVDAHDAAHQNDEVGDELQQVVIVVHRAGDVGARATAPG